MSTTSLRDVCLVTCRKCRMMIRLNGPVDKDYLCPVCRWKEREVPQ